MDSRSLLRHEEMQQLPQIVTCKDEPRISLVGVYFQPISGRVDRASATETVDSGSIPGRVIPKTIKIGIHSFPA